MIQYHIQVSAKLGYDDDGPTTQGPVIASEMYQYDPTHLCEFIILLEETIKDRYEFMFSASAIPIVIDITTWQTGLGASDGVVLIERWTFDKGWTLMSATTTKEN